jgi:hypothetical protein
VAHDVMRPRERGSAARRCLSADKKLFDRRVAVHCHPAGRAYRPLSHWDMATLRIKRGRSDVFDAML